MPTPKDDPAILEDWESFRKSRVSEYGESLRQVCLALGRSYGCSPVTVRRYLDPAYGERTRISDRISQARRYARYKHNRRYQRNYRHLTRNPKHYLDCIFDSSESEEADLDTIAAEIRELAEGVQFKSKTIERVLREYEASQHQRPIRGPPYLQEVSPSKWRYSDEPPKTLHLDLTDDPPSNQESESDDGFIAQ